MAAKDVDAIVKRMNERLCEIVSEFLNKLNELRLEVSVEANCDAMPAQSILMWYLLCRAIAMMCEAVNAKESIAINQWSAEMLRRQMQPGRENSRAPN